MSSGRIVIHIGYHRTGTTFIQNTLLSQYCDDYFVATPYNKNRELIEILTENNSLSAIEESLHEKFNNYFFRSIGDKKAIISSEKFSSIDTNVEEVASRLHSFFPEAHIVITLRSQYTHIPSMYANRLHKDDIFTINQFMDKLITNDYGFYKMLRLYVDLFSEDQVHILFFEDLQQDPVTYSKSFLNICGLDLVNPDVTFVKTSKNRGLGPLQVRSKLLFAKWPFLRRLAFSSAKRLDPIASKLGVNYSERIPKWNEVKLKLPDMYGDGNKRVAELTGVDLASKGYPLR